MTFSRDNAVQTAKTTAQEILAMLRCGQVRGAIHKLEETIDALETIQDGLERTAKKV